MEWKQLKKYGIGSLIVDCILFADILIDVCAGKLTSDNLLALLSINLLLAIPVIIIIKAKMRKRKNPTKLRNSESQECREDNSPDRSQRGYQGDVYGK